jgi:hypothetical protein
MLSATNTTSSSSKMTSTGTCNTPQATSSPPTAMATPSPTPPPPIATTTPPAAPRASHSSTPSSPRTCTSTPTAASCASTPFQDARALLPPGVDHRPARGRREHPPHHRNIHAAAVRVRAEHDRRVDHRPARRGRRRHGGRQGRVRLEGRRVGALAGGTAREL